MAEFSLEIFQNEYLAKGATTVDAIVTVTSGGWAPALTGQSSEVLIIDTSGSMDVPPARMRAARQAACEAIDRIRDGVLFAIIAGNERAETVFPVWRPSLVVADPDSRKAAKDVVRALQPGGGTAMSTWLGLARELFAGSPTALQHAILLTDGENREEPGRLEQELTLCRGLFQVDCRGVGTDWNVDELRMIASTLLGTVDIIPEPEQLAAEFGTLMEQAMGRGVGRAMLRVRCPKGVAVNFVRQVSPEVRELTHEAVAVDERTNGYALGAWGAESRDYHLSLVVPANGVGVEMLAGRVSLATDDQVVGPALIRAIWTDDAASVRVSPEVAHYEAQSSVAADIQAGLAALKDGDEHTATYRLGRAAQVAEATGNEGTVRLLQKVVEVDGGPRPGTVRLRAGIAKADQMALDTRSTMTVRVPAKKPRAGGAGAGGDDDMPLETRTSMTVRTRSKRKPAGDDDTRT
jgi:hypothetical protein